MLKHRHLRAIGLALVALAAMGCSDQAPAQSAPSGSGEYEWKCLGKAPAHLAEGGFVYYLNSQGQLQWVDSQVLPCLPSEWVLSARCTGDDRLSFDGEAFESNGIKDLSKDELTHLSCGGERPKPGLWPPPTT